MIPPGFRVVLICAAVALASTIATPQAVMAPGHVLPGAPLPRYVYCVPAADFAAPSGQPLVMNKFTLFLSDRNRQL